MPDIVDSSRKVLHALRSRSRWGWGAEGKKKGKEEELRLVCKMEFKKNISNCWSWCSSHISPLRIENFPVRELIQNVKFPQCILVHLQNTLGFFFFLGDLFYLDNPSEPRMEILLELIHKWRNLFL